METEKAVYGGGGEFRQWDELIPDALGLIFGKLALQEILTVIPRVCKSWGRAVAGPYCWQEIDIEEWSTRTSPHVLDRMLRLLLARSSGSLRKLAVVGLSSDSLFSLLAQQCDKMKKFMPCHIGFASAGSLQTLRIPRAEMNDSVVELFARSFANVTFLDVSYCGKIGSPALEAIGKNCKQLVGLCRNMHPLDTAGKPLEEDEAHAIATTMPKLRHLEMAYHLITTNCVEEILSSCTELEFFDLRGCWSVRLDDKLVKEQFPRLRVLGPIIVDHYERDNWDECSDFSDASSELLAWEFMASGMGDFDDDDSSFEEGMWDDDMSLQDLQFRFIGANEEVGEYGWPPSP